MKVRLDRSAVVERLDAASCEDKFQVVLHEQRYKFCLEQLTLTDRVLEVGTGLGYFSSQLIKQCNEYVGVEYDSRSCALTSERLGGYPIIRADAAALPFLDHVFSKIICLEVLEHLVDFRVAVREVHRCLSADGQVLISVPYRKRGGVSKINPYHIYEPGEDELVDYVSGFFSEVKVLYQTFEESWFMTLARNLHVRRFVGVADIYRALNAGAPQAVQRLRIGPRCSGLKLGLFLIASAPRR